ncbi:MAG: OmpA family protein [Gluconacetobacter diazotrophicus]|nr:OmpA family protein [Gluconacetobacter diazotrophicus]
MSPRRLLPFILPLALPLAVTACDHPPPGPNKEAEAVQAPPSTPLPTKPTTGQEAGAVADNQIQIQFGNGSTSLSPEADKKLDLAARLFRDANPVLMFTTGYSDNVGDEYHNLMLSARRAQTVKKALVARGIPADRLLLRAYGTSDPAKVDQPADAENRRVVVTWRLL